MSKRVSVSKSELEKVRKELKETRNLSIREINDKIDSEFKNYLYKGFNMDLEVFESLKQLYGEKIEHELVDFRNGVSYNKRISRLEKN